VHFRNWDAYGIFSLLLTYSVEPHTGLVKFDVTLINAFSNLSEVEESERLELLAKLLFLTESVNVSRLKRLEEKRKKEAAKRELEELKKGKVEKRRSRPLVLK